MEMLGFSNVDKFVSTVDKHIPSHKIDGDKTNYSKENLYLVPNYINGYILQYLGKLIKDQPELNKAHILRFEVDKAIKDYEKENKDFKKWRKNMNEYDPTNEGANE